MRIVLNKDINEVDIPARSNIVGFWDGNIQTDIIIEKSNPVIINWQLVDTITQTEIIENSKSNSYNTNINYSDNNEVLWRFRHDNNTGELIGTFGAELYNM